MTEHQASYITSPDLSAIRARIEFLSWDRQHVLTGPERPVGSAFVEER